MLNETKDGLGLPSQSLQPQAPATSAAGSSQHKAIVFIHDCQTGQEVVGTRSPGQHNYSYQLTNKA